MTDLDKIMLSPKASIFEALEVLVDSLQQIILVVDDSKRLIGTVVDGDIRRGILRKIPLENSISDIMNRTPATVTQETDQRAVLAIMQARGIHQIPVVDQNSQIIRLESLSGLLSKPTMDNWVLLMAGGQGNRLRPLTDDTPKPLLKVGGRPLISMIVDRFADQGFRKFIISVNYKADMFESHFGDGSSRNIEIEYLREEMPLGTAGALTLLPESPINPIIVMNADVMTTVNFRHLLAFHEEHNATATMCVREYDFEVPFGVVELDGPILKGVSEKPIQSFFVNAGIYVLSPEVLEVIPPKKNYDMTSLYKKLINKGHCTIAFPLREYWLDIGRMADLEKAQLDYPKLFR